MGLKEYSLLQQIKAEDGMERALPNIFRKRFDIIIPAYNEENRIRPVLSEICQFIGENKLPWKIIVAIDGNDGTLDIVKGYSATYDFVEYNTSGSRSGKGGSVKRTFDNLTGDFIILMDADGSIDFIEVIKSIPSLTDNDVIVLSRYSKDNDIPFIRRFLSRGFNVIVKAMTGLKLSDTQSGYKLFRASAFKDSVRKVQVTNAFYDVPMLYHINKMGYSVEEVQAKYVHSDGGKLRPFSMIMSFSVSITAFRIRNSRFYPYIPDFLIQLYVKKFKWI